MRASARLTSRLLQPAAAVALMTVILWGCAQGAAPGRSATPTPSQFRADAFRPFAGAPVIPQPRWAGVSSGTSDHVCVQVGDDQDYRSGDFVGGGWPGFIDGWRKHGRSKMGWIPRDPTQGPLRVTGTREGGGTYDEDLGFSDSYAPSTGYFWPDGPNVGRSGRWVFTLTAGSEWGCFTATF